MQLTNYLNNIEGVSVGYICEACRQPIFLVWEEEMKLGSDRIVVENTIRGIRRKFICNSCYQNNWRLTGGGVLINETPVKKRGTTK